MRLIMGDTTGDENIGYYIFGIYYIIAAIFNMSFFLFETRYFRKNRFNYLISFYLSSLVTFVIGTLAFLYDIITNIDGEISILENIILPIILYYSYFIVNFAYALFLKKHISIKQ